MRIAVQERFGEVSFQDAGRVGWRKHGVPPAGPWCRDLATVAAALAGHGLQVPVLEVGGALTGRVEEAGQVAWPGGGTVEADGVPLTAGLHFLPRGTALRASAGRDSARLYLATPGGWQAPRPLGSACGPAGDELCSAGPTVRKAPVLWGGGRAVAEGALRIVPIGPLPEARTLRVSRSSRMGVLLSGSPPGPRPSRDSLPATPGAVQWVPDGELIVLGPDGPTVGGYSVVGWMAEPDLWRLGSAPLGSEFRIQAVTPAQADEAGREAIGRLTRLVQAARGG